MKIPEQLKDMKFCRVRYKTKEPFETDWTNKHYTAEQIKSYLDRENYGVLTGINGLGVLDDDSEDKRLLKLALEIGETFRVRDHLYFKLKDWDGKKIIFYDSNGKHLGELQGLGQQVVGAGSIHPSGETYDIKNNADIISVEADVFKAVFSEYLIERKSVVHNSERTDWTGDKIQDIPITNIISLAGLRDMGNSCYQGSHIVHGSEGGMNFRVDTLNNVWYCFRHSSGGGSAELIGVVEGVIDCSQAGSNCFNEGQGRRVIEVAREKYGLRKPKTNNSIKEPMGWALSIDIRRMAERHNLNDCPKCKIPFLFNSRLGFFKCKSCGSYGGLKMFALLCHKNNQINERRELENEQK